MAENTVQEASIVKQDETREPERFRTPAVDIYETEAGLTLVADLAGVEADGLEVRVEDSLLTLQGMPQSGRSGEPVWAEYTLIPYYRQFKLNEAIDQERIEADLRHGTLTLRLPKTEKLKPRKIAVTTQS